MCSLKFNVPEPHHNRTNLKKNIKKNMVLHGCVLYAYSTCTSARKVPGIDTFCILEYPCFKKRINILQTKPPKTDLNT